MSKLHGLRPSQCANGITVSIFTVFPVIMFSTILVLKLRGNYLEEIEHLRSNVERLGLQANTCLAEQEGRIRRLHLLETYQKKCSDTLGKASMTLSSLNKAFRMQWDRSDQAMAALKNDSRVNYLQEVDQKVNLTHELVSQNAMLRGEVQDLHNRLNNVTHSKMFLEGQLGKVKTDLDGLKSNTSRLEGEKKGLEKVLEVKAEVENENKLAGSVLEKAIDLKKEKKKIIGTVKALLKKNKKKLDDEGDEDNEDEDGDEEDEDEDLIKTIKKKKKLEEIDLDDDDDGVGQNHDSVKQKHNKKMKEKESIEKIVKEHIKKLGLVSSNSTKLTDQQQQQVQLQPLQPPQQQQLQLLPQKPPLPILQPQPQQEPVVPQAPPLFTSPPISANAVPQALPQSPQGGQPIQTVVGNPSKDNIAAVQPNPMPQPQTTAATTIAAAAAGAAAGPTTVAAPAPVAPVNAAQNNSIAKLSP